MITTQPRLGFYHGFDAGREKMVYIINAEKKKRYFTDKSKNPCRIYHLMLAFIIIQLILLFPACSLSDTGSAQDISSRTASGSTESAKIEVTTSQGVTTVEPGEITQTTLAKGDEALFEAVCKKAADRIELIRLAYGGMKFEETPAIVQYNSASFASVVGICIASSSGVSGSSSPMKMKITLQQGPIKAKVINDQVELSIETPTAIISSQGANSFGVAYDPKSEKSYVITYENPVRVQPTDSNRAPFTLESGRQAVIEKGQKNQGSSSSQPLVKKTTMVLGSKTIGSTFGGSTSGSTTYGGSTIQGSIPTGSITSGAQGGCYTDPMTGEITCVDSYGEPTLSQVEAPAGCYRDPMTGEITCVDSSGEPSGSSGGSSGAQSGPQGGCYQDPVTGDYVCVD